MQRFGLEAAALGISVSSALASNVEQFSLLSLLSSSQLRLRLEGHSRGLHQGLAVPLHTQWESGSTETDMGIVFTY